ncbi:DNA-directed RNA polymerase subunit alpha C-terminal domain-containing protein [Pseudofrankia inefficax]|nr:DNA-directed RNA polymerase subunit alpha C-terminal domain-containing protein [Pseudofrankia inefficax]
MTDSAAGWAGRSAREALMVVAPQFLHSRSCLSVIREQYADRAGDEVTLYGLVRAREVLVLGQSQFADQVREVLRAGQVPGWGLHELPAERAPVSALYALLSVRTANILKRAPFLFAQEVAALPDEVLREFRGLGPRVLAEIRAALADPALANFRIDLASPESDASSEDLPEDLASRLRPEHQARYRDFLRGLAAVGLPAERIEKILGSLDGEPVPAADPVVRDILLYAGADELLDAYDETHDQAALATSEPFLPALPSTAARLARQVR